MNASVLAYFDTSVFGHLVERAQGITAGDDEQLRAAVKSGALSVLPGVHAIDETMRHPRDPVPQLRLIWELCDWNRVVKPADILLTDDIRRFAYSADAAHPFIQADQPDQLREAMQSLLADRAKIAELRTLVQSVYSQRRQFGLKIRELQRETRADFLAAKEREHVCSFDEYFEKESRLAAGGLADRVGLKHDCESRSLDKFLKIRSVRMAAGMMLSYIWAVNVEGRKVKPSDSGDLQHSVPAAAAADVFVTHDSGLASIARRVPLRGFRVAALKDLLRELG